MIPLKIAESAGSGKAVFLYEICAGKRAITAETALRLARFFGTDAQSWLNLQAHYDLECLEPRMADRIEQEVVPFREAA